jgi:hypothetical protein
MIPALLQLYLLHGVHRNASDLHFATSPLGPIRRATQHHVIQHESMFGWITSIYHYEVFVYRINGARR